MAALGYAGLLPFYACALWLWVPDVGGRALAADVFIVYGAVILAFLGGTLWGHAVSLPPPGKLWRLALSNAVALFAAVAALVTTAVLSVLLLAVGQLGLLIYERSSAPRPGWYLQLRTRLVVAVLPAHALVVAVLYRYPPGSSP